VSASGQAAAGGRRSSTARDRPNELITLVKRLIFAQAWLAGAIGLSYSRRNGPWIVITLMLAVALCGLAAAVRSGSHAAWVFAVGFEAAFVALGLFRFLTARFMGGTLFGIATLCVLVHPAVTRAFGGPRREGRRELGEPQLGEFGSTASDALGGQAPG
jgi:hypothetical protein